ncbi:adenosylcobinamide-GDP ribazoletransferase [Carboxylicivirga sp. M1479]|uniref:adenosylcobinamide-GDP ribazoletransferase n=1 Tax=Carboxylicivirga sp. M1479 TaxID=2594476 RepID=UPI00117839D7|nr:adenosylcobinamide-GDP ribazoletransferase [Carboxylicivirga sp. M1479]TRX70994.1 adenosylcobinamide-GDP ribazoletransferase [Carboxylicivirga sp. M1479]
MKQQFHLLLTAFGFFTRIPIPYKFAFSQSYLNQCNRYLPLVGYVVGGISASVFFASSQIFSSTVAIVLSMITSILVTGAFHEDGLADVCDAFGGGWTKEKILTIMKDSRVGAYGAIGIILSLLLKFVSLNELPHSFIIKTIIIGHVVSRTMAVWTMHSLNYVREDESSKSKPITKALHIKDLVIAGAWSIFAFIPFFDVRIFLILIPTFITKYCLERYFKKWIGGYTGDCLGTIQQVTEQVIYLAILALAGYVAYQSSAQGQISNLF